MSFKFRSLQRLMQSKATRTLSVLASLMFVLASTGCIMSSISESSGSFSDSSNSSSKSSQSSSDESKESYLRDVKQYTAVYTRSNRDLKGLPQGLSMISAKHGVTDWEAYQATYLGIGEGFAKAAVTQQQVDIYSALLTHGDQQKVAAIQQGFRQGQ